MIHPLIHTGNWRNWLLMLAAGAVAWLVVLCAIAGATSYTIPANGHIGDTVAKYNGGHNRFVLAGGARYVGDSCTLNTGDTLESLSTDTMDGNWTLTQAVMVPDTYIGNPLNTQVYLADSLVIKNITFQHYGAMTWYHGVMDLGNYNYIYNCRFVDDSLRGIRMRGTHNIIRKNYFDSCGQNGISGTQSDSILIDSNTFININPLSSVDDNGYMGAVKLGRTTGAIFRANTVRKCNTNGLWTDIYCNYTLYEYNTFDSLTLGNPQAYAAYDEISKNGIIRYNTFNYNQNYSINLAGSCSTQVYENTIYMDSTSQYGIGIVITTRSDTTFSQIGHRIYNNDIIVKSIKANLVNPIYLYGVQTTTDSSNAVRNYQFYNNNAYIPNSSRKYWKWYNVLKSLPEMKSLGQEAGSCEKLLH